MTDRPDRTRDARDAVWAALSEPDRLTALRATAIDLSGQGLPRAAVTGAFATVAEELAAEGRDEESRDVAYILDMIVEWHGVHRGH